MTRSARRASVRLLWGAGLGLAGCGQFPTDDLEGAGAGPSLETSFETAVYGDYAARACGDVVPVCFRSEDGQSCVRTVLLVDECADDAGQVSEFWACDQDRRVDVPNARFSGSLFWGHGSLFLIGAFEFDDGERRDVNVEATPDRWTDFATCAPPPS